MKRALIVLAAGVLGTLLACCVLVGVFEADMFHPRYYIDANEWFGLSLLVDLMATGFAFFILFALATGFAPRVRGFAPLFGGFVLATVVLAAFAFLYRPAPRSLRTDYHLFGVFAWVLLSIAFGLTARWWFGRRDRR